MKSKGAEGLPAGPQGSVAANEEFEDEVDGYAPLTRPPSGWDPYEVWRTRVKESSRTGEREADPRG
jgi:hypothetical protein